MPRVKYAASVALITLGATGLLADRALPLPDLRAAHNLAVGSPIQKASCRRWWQWQGVSLGPKLLACWL
jgi:hypothetical protein